MSSQELKQPKVTSDKYTQMKRQDINQRIQKLNAPKIPYDPRITKRPSISNKSFSESHIPRNIFPQRYQITRNEFWHINSNSRALTRRQEMVDTSKEWDYIYKQNELKRQQSHDFGVLLQNCVDLPIIGNGDEVTENEKVLTTSQSMGVEDTMKLNKQSSHHKLKKCHRIACFQNMKYKRTIRQRSFTDFRKHREPIEIQPPIINDKSNKIRYSLTFLLTIAIILTGTGIFLLYQQLKPKEPSCIRWTECPLETGKYILVSNYILEVLNVCYTKFQMFLGRLYS